MADQYIASLPLPPVDPADGVVKREVIVTLDGTDQTPQDFTATDTTVDLAALFSPGQDYVVSLDDIDAAGNRSEPRTVSGTVPQPEDTTPPKEPGEFSLSFKIAPAPTPTPSV